MGISVHCDCRFDIVIDHFARVTKTFLLPA